LSIPDKAEAEEKQVDENGFEEFLLEPIEIFHRQIPKVGCNYRGNYSDFIGKARVVLRFVHSMTKLVLSGW
jgi:hypothetical protein